MWQISVNGFQTNGANVIGRAMREYPFDIPFTEGLVGLRVGGDIVIPDQFFVDGYGFHSIIITGYLGMGVKPLPMASWLMPMVTNASLSTSAITSFNSLTCGRVTVHSTRYRCCPV